MRLPFGSSPPRLGLTEVVTLRAHARAALPQFLAACLLSSCLCATARSSPPCFPSLTKEIPLRAVPQAERWVLPPLRARAVATPPPSAVRARCGAGAVRARCGGVEHRRHQARRALPRRSTPVLDAAAHMLCKVSDLNMMYLNMYLNMMEPVFKYMFKYMFKYIMFKSDTLHNMCAAARLVAQRT